MLNGQAVKLKNTGNDNGEDRRTIEGKQEVDENKCNNSRAGGWGEHNAIGISDKHLKPTNTNNTMELFLTLI